MTNRAYPWDKPTLSQGQAQVLSLFYTMEAQFVPGTNPVKGGRKSLCVKRHAQAAHSPRKPGRTGGRGSKGDRGLYGVKKRGNTISLLRASALLPNSRQDCNFEHCYALVAVLFKALSVLFMSATHGLSEFVPERFSSSLTTVDAEKMTCTHKWGGLTCQKPVPNISTWAILMRQGKSSQNAHLGSPERISQDSLDRPLS